MLKYFKNISKNVIICYAIAIITLLLMFVLSYAILYNITPQVLITANRILIIAAFVIVGGACFLVSMYMKRAVISPDENIYVSQDLSFYLKRVISLPLLTGLIGFGISFIGGVIFSFLLDSLTKLRENNFALFCAIVKIPLFIGFVVVLAVLLYHNGFDDSAVKSFNPHLMLVALILSFAFMMPVTVGDYMYENLEVRGSVSYMDSGRTGSRSQGKRFYNVQTAFSNNEDLYKDNYDLTLNENFSDAWVITSILLSMAIQIFCAMAAYDMGRKKYYKKHKLYNHGGTIK